ncbi:NAD(P)/FAD-dependent oxidoreductase [Escherichia coli]|uniref:NAD(P)/FAD-dependent oxidoreductase n=1 Tax=Enterobacteriaceae TaxID=543 RepID=UPI00257AAFC4|nr:NAD(P)/FAD-dependent oxidoreductase [Citrobacter sp. Cb016]ELX9580986.1 NAD(P)/FAD-dependent oxidoreductase [Escherichia coli]MDM3397788.1 NAD(P)/FAD-dependent oxidoreductase [Citrobacter sp. Cb016]
MPNKDKRIAVLGAGPMGLAVAYQLTLEGYKPIIYEADNRVGGMTASFDFNGLEIERYYHFHCISDHAFLKILDELGLSDKMHWVETKMGYWFKDRLQPWGNPIALLKFRGLSLTAKFRYGLHAFLSTKRNDWRPLDNVEATGWIKRWVGEEAYEVLWRKLFELKFYEYTSGLSAAWIWSRIRRIGRSRYNLFREKLGYLDGGSSTLLEAMKAEIESKGGEFRLNSFVKKVTIEEGRVTGVTVGDSHDTFDTVISTIPLPYVSKLIPDLPSDIINKLNDIKNIAVVCVIAKLRKAVTENFWLNTNDPDMDIPGIVEYSNLRPLDNHVVYVPFYMPGENPKFLDDDSVFLLKVKNYLKKINPSLTDDDFIDIRASRYRYAQPICDPGYLSRLPSVAMPIDGLFVADTSYYYPEDRGISESIDFGRKMAKDAVL